MKHKIASEEVVHVLNNWYHAIMKSEIEKAISIKEDIDRMLPDMEDNESVILYCQMLKLKYSMLLQRTNESLELFEENQTGGNVDETLDYYYYFFRGVYEAYRSNNSNAIDFFKAAESKLSCIDDELERAEFHYRIGTTYYHMKSTILSENHLNQALRIFNKHQDYCRRRLTCSIALALNYIDQSEFEKAETLLTECAQLAKSLGDQFIFGLSVFNLGYSKLKEDKLSEAVLYIEQSLSVEELKKNAPFAYLHCVYEAVRSYFKLGNIEKALEWLQEGFSQSTENDKKIFFLKFKTLHSLYVLEDNEKVTECVELLEKKKSFVDVEALAIDIAHYYNNKKDFERSVLYYEKSLNATKHILK
ncbi:response regulator aspartate phosphatase [Bacillus cabrialesii]|uniref:response regulator aspartate phosphatase n=1 Tax=Bacillus cabrialesii TaxID=2487276 RepID=UPI0028FAB420|nr:aspartate phosphatase [Bacillus cabrialesii]MDU0153964.1 aspartate phosphatase [Bacillus cabrialesii]